MIILLPIFPNYFNRSKTSSLKHQTWLQGFSQAMECEQKCHEAVRWEPSYIPECLFCALRSTVQDIRQGWESCLPALDPRERRNAIQLLFAFPKVRTISVESHGDSATSAEYSQTAQLNESQRAQTTDKQRRQRYNNKRSRGAVKQKSIAGIHRNPATKSNWKC